MPKRITRSQLIGEIGEAAARVRFLRLGFQFDVRSRLEAGIDAIAEVMIDGQPLAQMIAVQVKTTETGRYSGETDDGFSYLLKKKDLAGWKSSNLPVIIVLYRESDETFFWKHVGDRPGVNDHKLFFSKLEDKLDEAAKDKLAALTVPKAGLGYYVPPLGNGEEAIVNMLPISLPREMFVAYTQFSTKKALSLLNSMGEGARYDWVIKGNSLWSFHDPRENSTDQLVDTDQVEAIDTSYLAFHEDKDEINTFSFLLKQVLKHQYRSDLRWEKAKGILYFRAHDRNKSRRFEYVSSKNKTSAAVVSVHRGKKDKDRISFVRHHAMFPRFERLMDQWYLVITPTYHFTTNGFTPHSYPSDLLANKKRDENNAALRGQVIMWHRLLTQNSNRADELFDSDEAEPEALSFGAPPVVELPTRVPDDVWGSSKQKVEASTDQQELKLDEL